MWGARGPFPLAAAMVVAVVMPVVFCNKARARVDGGRSPNHFGPMDPSILGIAGKHLSL
jgi:hypothetical protein